jgi:hypothetical protein
VSQRYRLAPRPPFLGPSAHYRKNLPRAAAPLLARALRVDKMTLAALALDAGIITPQELMPIACGGGLAYAGRYARCWTTHGVRMNLPMALRHSSPLAKW